MPDFTKAEDRYHGIELATIESVLLLYCQALTGREVLVTSTKVPVTHLRNNWWAQLVSGNQTDEHLTVSLPPNFMRFASYDENFFWYKCAATQQVGHSEFGSSYFCFERESYLFENLRYQIKGEEVQGESAFAKYFSLFDNRALAARAFVAAENTRINYLVKHFYPGIKGSYMHMQEDVLLSLTVPGMSLRHIFCLLVEAIETGAVSAAGTDELYPMLESAAAIIATLCNPSATVEDSAEAAIRIYNLALAIPESRIYKTVDSYSQGDGSELIDDIGEFTGDFNAGEIKLNLNAKEAAGKGSAMPMTAEELKKLSDIKVDISDISNAQSLPSTGLSSSDLPRLPVYEFSQSKYRQVDRCSPGVDETAIELEADEKLFRYDEWDFRKRGYINEWCCVREKIIHEGNSLFYDNTLESRRVLLADIKKQFEKLPAEMLYKARNLDDGDEFDLDLVISEKIDKRAGHTPSGKVYWKKKKIQRDVAVAFLLDMSASTADLIKKNRTTMQYEESIRYNFIKFVMKQHRRIIDVEKEAIVLLCSAIEMLGDNYGIYGFSGHGHNKVQFMVIKDLNESFSEKIKRRVDGIVPIHGTRMGPAIRHTTAKLDACSNSLKLLFLVSDGYPQDAMYGMDDDDKQYAINDTKMALIEATRKNITPFCLTVDSAGTDYLRTMCQDIGYEVLEDTECLPQHLPMLYKKLSA